MSSPEGALAMLPGFGVAAASAWASAAATLAIIAACMAVIAWMFKTGYRLKQ